MRVSRELFFIQSSNKNNIENIYIADIIIIIVPLKCEHIRIVTRSIPEELTLFFSWRPIPYYIYSSPQLLIFYEKPITTQSLFNIFIVIIIYFNANKSTNNTRVIISTMKFIPS